MDKRGQTFATFNIFTFIVVAFLVILLFAGWIYVTGLLNNVFTDVGLKNEVNAGQPGYVNMTLASEHTFGVMNSAIKSLRMVAFVYILCLGAVIILTNALIKMHPIFYVAYLLIAILGVIFAVPISNAYLNLLNSGIFEGELQNFTAANFVVLNLPIFTLVIGLFGAVLLFVSLIRTDQEPMLR